jgi:S-formylglutathione hydrolase FrmB
MLELFVIRNFSDGKRRRAAYNLYGGMKMAHIEFNALSVYLGGTFSSQIYLPEMDKLALDDDKHETRYPVLWLIHSEGGASCDWNYTRAEACAVEHGIFIIASDIGHSLCTDMDYGPEYEKFLYEELPGICRNTFPISADPGLNWIGGVGTGAYGAAKLALGHPGVYSRCFLLDGVLDMAEVCDKAASGSQPGYCHTASSLEAVFGKLELFRSSRHDIFELAKTARSGEYYVCSSSGSSRVEEYKVFAGILGQKAVLKIGDYPVGDPTYSAALSEAVRWACR